MRLAIFDVDGTLISGKSTEKRFIAWLVRRGRIGPRQMLAMAWFVVRWFPVYGRHVFRKNKAYLAGLSVSLVAEEARAFAQALPEDAFIEPVLAELRRHRESGDVVLLLSGTLQPIVDTLCRRLGADGGFGAEGSIVRERYTGRPPVRHPFHVEKRTMVAAIGEKYAVAAGEISAYADSRFDIPILSEVGDPAAVGPDRGLARWAKRHNCRIIETA